MTDYTTIEELMRIKEEMEELIGQAREILGGTQYYDQADAYWLGHIESALGNGTYSMCSMRDTIQEIEGCSY
jgi:predicted oxidoreductase